MSTSPLSSLWSRAVPGWSLGRFLRRRTVLRSRRALLLLDEHLLRDIGLTAAQARAEATRTDWDAPAHWRG